MSNRDHLTIDQLTGQRRVRTRQEKVGLAISLLAFFGAIAVVGWFAISGYQSEDGAEPSGPRVLFEGGEYRNDVAAGSTDEGAEPVGEDDHVVGNFGDPVDELYADDSAGDWGTSALERSAPDAGGERSGPPRTGRISRGRGGEN